MGLVPRVRAELVGRRRKALLVVPTSASPICSFPAGPQGFSSFPWQLEARGAEQGLCCRHLVCRCGLDLAREDWSFSSKVRTPHHTRTVCCYNENFCSLQLSKVGT